MFWVGFEVLSEKYPQLRGETKKLQEYMERTELQAGDVIDLSHVSALTGIKETHLERIFKREVAEEGFQKVYRLRCPIWGGFVDEQDEPYSFPVERYCDLHGEDHEFTEEDCTEGYRLLFPGIRGKPSEKQRPMVVIQDSKELTPEIVRGIVREEISSAMNKSEERTTFLIKMTKEELERQIEQYQAETLKEIRILSSEQFTRFKELISEKIGKEIEEIEDEQKKEESKDKWNKIKEVLSRATDALSVMVNVISIFSLFKAGNMWEAIDLIISTVQTVLAGV